MEILDILLWLVALFIPASYIIQIKSNYIHKETRDFKISSLMVADLAYLVYGIKSGFIGEFAFLLKYGLSFTFCSIMIAQILLYRKKHYEWHDDIDQYCSGQVKDKVVCGNELEPHWKHCPDCGARAF